MLFNKRIDTSSERPLSTPFGLCNIIEIALIALAEVFKDTNNLLPVLLAIAQPSLDSFFRNE